MKRSREPGAAVVPSAVKTFDSLNKSQESAKINWDDKADEKHEEAEDDDVIFDVGDNIDAKETYKEEN